MSSLEDRKTKGIIFNIQKYSVHDGPGIRTIVFLKGCHLRCRWCSNPESQEAHPQMAFNKTRCLGLDKCTHCLEVCMRGAILRGDDNSVSVNHAICERCSMPCVGACPGKSLISYGEEKTVEECIKKVQQDSPFYARSGGGMTLSGGEPFFQARFAIALLREARKRFIRTAVETCGMAKQEDILEGGKYLNYILFDIKHMDPQVHAAQTGVENGQILENFRALCEEFPSTTILARTPIIPGFNDNSEAVQAIAEFLLPFGAHVEYEMLPYHRLGTQKYDFLGIRPPMGEEKLDEIRFERLRHKVKTILGDRLHIPH